MSDFLSSEARSLDQRAEPHLSYQELDSILTHVRHWCAKAREKNASPLYLACEAGDVEGAKAIMHCTFDMVKDEGEKVRRYFRDTLDERINHGEEDDDIYENATPSHVAAQFGHAEVVRTLISYGANIEARNLYQLTPLHYAAFYGQSGIVSLLLQHKANIEAEDDDECTPLYFAAHKGFADIASVLVAQKANIDVEDKSLRTLLHVAAEEGHGEIVSLLIAHNAKIDVMDEDGLTPLDLATEREHSEVISVLSAVLNDTSNE